MPRLIRYAAQFLFLCSLLAPTASAQAAGANPAPMPVANQPATSPAFDVHAAIETYFAKMPPAERARSNSYFEGGYWLLLWDFLSTVIVMWLLLRFRCSMRMRDLAQRITGLRPLQTALYWVQFIVVVSVLTFPLGLYEGY